MGYSSFNKQFNNSITQQVSWHPREKYHMRVWLGVVDVRT